jgi:hypothetical protein
MIRLGFLDSELRRDLTELARDGSAEHWGLARLRAALRKRCARRNLRLARPEIS